VKQPNNIKSAVGSSITFSITAKGGYLKFNWKKINHDSLPSNVIGQHSPSLTFTSVMPADDNEYYCVVKDLWGYHVKSNKATLTVLSEFSQQIV